jgi:hypothetical protein
MASVHFAAHRSLSGIEAARRSVDIARQAGSLEAECDSLTTETWCLNLLGRFSEAQAASKAKAAVAERAGALAAAYEARGELAISLIEGGRYDVGCAAARRTEAAAEREGLAWASTFNGEQELRVLIWRGRFEDARRRLERLVAHGHAENRRRWVEVELLMATGELEQALAIEEVSIEQGYAPEIFAMHDALRRVELFDRLGGSTGWSRLRSTCSPSTRASRRSAPWSRRAAGSRRSRARWPVMNPFRTGSRSRPRRPCTSRRRG